jgi:hemoglobin
MVEQHDIRNRDDVMQLVRAFYAKATGDPVIGHFFTTVVQLNWDKHIPRIVDFWTTLLFGGGLYSGNPMEAHIHLNKLSPMQQQHFDKWVELWTATVDALFSGPKAEEAKMRGASIATIMHLKLG